MSVADGVYVCDHAEGEDPRQAGSCVKCGKPMPKPVRNHEYEQLYLDRVCSETERRFGIPASAYTIAVQHRLAVGKERYGDEAFMHKDLLIELLEETPDVAAYCLMETQKQLASGLEADDNRIFWLHEAAIYAAAAHHCATQARTSNDQ